MGFLDSVKSGVQRGKDSVGRKTHGTQLKMQLNDLEKQRKDLMTQLGASLYEELKGHPELVAGRESLIQQVEAVDQQRKAIEDELARLEAEAAAAVLAAQQSRASYNCQRCGAPLNENDMFCTACGNSVSEYIAEKKAQIARQQMTVSAPDGSAGYCTECGAPLTVDAKFCISCGAVVEQFTPAPMPMPAQAPQGFTSAPTPGQEPAPQGFAPATQGLEGAPAGGYGQPVQASVPVAEPAMPVAEPVPEMIPVAEPIAAAVSAAEPVAVDIPVAEPVGASPAEMENNKVEQPGAPEETDKSE